MANIESASALILTGVISLACMQYSQVIDGFALAKLGNKFYCKKLGIE